MYRIYKEFSFDAAHRIYGHFGKCKNLHGHTYTVILYLESKELDSYKVVHDYYNFKALKDHIDEKFDHSLMVANEDFELKNVAEMLGKKTIILGATTAEYLAEYFYDISRSLFGDIVHSAEVKETAKTGATFYGHK